MTERTKKKRRLLNAFATGIKPEQKKPIVDWCRENVKANRSSRSTFLDLEQTPWLIDIFKASIDDATKEVVVQASTGSGKTSLIEGLSLYTLLERPCPLMLVAQTDADISDWMTTGLLPAIQENERVKKLLPNKRFVLTKGLLNFPHMPVYITGANMAGLQGKSVSLILADELHLWKPGMIDQMRKRLHDRPFARSVLFSQPGRQFDDFDNAFNQTEKREFMYECPSCSTRHPWRFDRLKWDDAPLAELQPVYECPCGHCFTDDTQTRRAMSESGKYEAIPSENPVSDHLGFTYNALCVWWVSWKSLVVEWLQANEFKKKGNLLPLESFITKRLAQPWQEREFLKDDVEIERSSYSLQDREQWEKTFMTCDKQANRFYYVVRTFNKSGESRLLDYGMVINYKDLEDKQKEWNIPGNQVAIDTAYDTQSVLGACAANGWFGLNGFRSESFNVQSKTGRSYKRVYSQPSFTKSNIGTARSYLFSSSRIKDLLAALKRGDGIKWEIPHDVTKDYLDSLNSEIKVANADGSFNWKTIRERNDLWDCECEMLVLAMIHKTFPELQYES